MINYITYLIVLIALTPVNTLEVSPFAVPASKWKYEIPITIQESQIPGTTDWTGYPMYINLSSLGTHFWTYVKAGGADIRVFDTDGTTELPIHVLSFTDNGTSGTGSLFAKVTLDADTDKAIYLRYGNPSATAYAVGDTYGQYNTWTTLFQGWGLTETSGTFASLISGGTTFTVSVNVSGATGKLEKAAVYNSTGVMGDGGTTFDINTTGTMVAWVKIGTINTSANYIILGTEGSASDRWFVYPNASTNRGRFATREGGGNNNADTSNPLLGAGDDGTWNMLGWRHSSGTVAVFKNGSSVAMADASINSVVTTTENITIGRSSYDDAYTDMFIYFSAAVIDDHMTALYNNQNTPNSFKSVAAPRSLWLPQSVN